MITPSPTFGHSSAALTGLAPIAQDSGALRGKRLISGGRHLLRHVMFQAALVASYHNPVLKTFSDRLRDAGKPHKVVITAVARKLVTIVNEPFRVCRRLHPIQALEPPANPERFKETLYPWSQVTQKDR